MSQRFRELDSTRLVHYEGTAHDRRYNDTTDMESQMYTPVWKIRQYLEEHRDKPSTCANTPTPWVTPTARCTNIPSTPMKSPCIRAALSGISSTRASA